MSRITLLTDFGTADGYVAAMRGVITTIAPGTCVLDASHDIAPGDVRAAAWVLRSYWNTFPRGTVHLGVVDPGVGTSRRALAAEVGGHVFVAPDNGLLTYVLEQAGQLVSITNLELRLPHVSATFHGRDVFAPAAAHLSAGVPLTELGSEAGDPVRLPIGEPEVSVNAVTGTVVHVDRFGNLITNVWEDLVPGGNAVVRVAGREIGGLRRTYAEVEPGELLALIGSAGSLEISVRGGSAADLLRVGPGTGVTVAGV